MSLNETYSHCDQFNIKNVVREPSTLPYKQVSQQVALVSRKAPFLFKKHSWLKQKSFRTTFCTNH